MEEASHWLATHWEAWRMANFLSIVCILAIAFLLTRLLKSIERRMAAHVSFQGRSTTLREKQIKTMLSLVRSTGTVIIVVFAVLTVLPELGISVEPLTVVAGFASIAVGFGAQNLVRDWIAGALIVYEDQFVVGETVQIGDTTGRVEELTLRQTVLRDLQGARVHIPNGEIRKLANLSRDFSQIFLDVQIPAHEAGDRALAALDRVAAEFRADAAWAPALVDGPRVLGYESLSPAGATVRVQVRTVPLRQNDVARELRRRIVARFAQDGVGISSEHRVVLVSSSALPGAAAADPVQPDSASGPPEAGRAQGAGTN